MVKRKVIKKKVKDKVKDKRKNKNGNVETRTKGSGDSMETQKPLYDRVKNMSRLEYEQSMMDPRFRAAMAGFGVGQTTGKNKQINQRNDDLNKRLGDNNALTNQIALKEEIFNVQKKNTELKEELKRKMQEQANDKARFEAEMKQQQLQRDLESQAKEHEYQKQIREKEMAFNELKYNTAIESNDMRHKLDEQKRKYQEQQTRFNNEQEKLDKEHKLMMAQMKEQHRQVIEPLTSSIKDLARKSDLDNLQFRAADEIANATVDKTKAEIKNQIQEEILPLKQATEQAKRELELTKTIYEQHNQLEDARTKNIIEGIHAKIQPQIQALENQSNELKRHGQLLNAQSNAINDFKDAQKRFIEESLRHHFDGITTQLDNQTKDIKRMTETQQMMNAEQNKIKNAQFELTEAHIKAINAPLIQALENQKQQLENTMRVNGDVNGIAQKIEDLKTDIQVLKQKATPQQIQEHAADVREMTLKAAPLQITKRLAEQTNSSNIAYEKLYSDVVESGARALGEDFKIEDIGTPALNEKLKNKNVEIQQKRALIAKQHETINKQLELRKSLENAELEKEIANARLEVVDEHSSSYNNALKIAAKKRVQIENETKKLDEMKKQVEDVQEHHEKMYSDILHKFNSLMEVHPFYKKIAQEVSGQEEPDPRCLPKVIDRMKEIDEDVKRKMTEMDPKYLMPGTFPELQNAIATLEELYRARNIHINDARNNLRMQRDIAETDNQHLHEQLEDKQKRLNQASTFMNCVYHDSTRPYRKYDPNNPNEKQDDEFWTGDVGKDSNDERTVGRDFDSRSHIHVTADRMRGWENQAGIDNVE